MKEAVSELKVSSSLFSLLAINETVTAREPPSNHGSARSVVDASNGETGKSFILARFPHQPNIPALIQFPIENDSFFLFFYF